MSNALDDPGGVRERLLLAVGALATSAEPLARRLLFAVQILAPLQAEDFSDGGALQRFTALFELVTAQAARGDEGRLEATIEAMSDDQRIAAAKMIFELHSMYHPLT